MFYHALLSLQLHSLHLLGVLGNNWWSQQCLSEICAQGIRVWHTDEAAALTLVTEGHEGQGKTYKLTLRD